MGGGGMLGGPGAPPPPPPDQVALMCQRLQGFHLTGRKEAAYTLGQLGDPRAVPTLIHVLKYDNFKDVRIASAIALGEIGGSEAAVALERSAVYDHREDVKKAASTALERLNAKAKAMASMPQPTRPSLPPDSQPHAGVQSSAPATTPSPFREVPPAGGPTPAAVDSCPLRMSSPRRRRQHRSPQVTSRRGTLSVLSYGLPSPGNLDCMKHGSHGSHT